MLCNLTFACDTIPLRIPVDCREIRITRIETAVIIGPNDSDAIRHDKHAVIVMSVCVAEERLICPTRIETFC